MVEAFARSLVYKIMLEVLDVLDNHTRNEKNWINYQDHPAEYLSHSETTHIITRAQLHDHAHADDSQQDATETITRMVNDFRNVHIGDSTNVSPSAIPILERQIKLAVSSIGSTSVENAADGAEMRIAQGQGDVDQIMHSTAFAMQPEDSSGSTAARNEKAKCDANETSKVSVSMMLRMIDELITEVKKPSERPDDDNHAPDVVRENIAAWEETEEQLIQTIEGVGDTDENVFDDIPRTDYGNRLCFSAVEETIPFASSSVELALQEVALKKVSDENVIPPSPSLAITTPEAVIAQTKSEIVAVDEAETTLATATSKKKKTIGGRIKTLFCFGRRRHRVGRNAS